MFQSYRDVSGRSQWLETSKSHCDPLYSPIRGILDDPYHCAIYLDVDSIPIVSPHLMVSNLICQKKHRVKVAFFRPVASISVCHTHRYLKHMGMSENRFSPIPMDQSYHSHFFTARVFTKCWPTHSRRDCKSGVTTRSEDHLVVPHWADSFEI
jgi:hypothetical protein